MSRNRKALVTLLLALAAMLVVAGCKEMISPHVPPEADADLIVARAVAAIDPSVTLVSPQSQKRITITLNNAPEADQPLEQDFVQQLVELFEKRNPDIQIQFSPWQYTPESFFERVKNRTLTDVVEVEASQMPPIIDLNCAADITANVAASAEIRIMNPEVFKVVSKDGRTYGVPAELHTMALFFNRRLVENVLRPPKPPAEEKKVPEKKAPEKQSTEKKKGKGADGEPRDFLEELPMEKEPIVLAQYQQYQQQGYSGNYYQPSEEEDPRKRQRRRGEQEVQDLYNVQPQQQQQQPRRQQGGGFWGNPNQQQNYQQGYQQQQQPGYGQQQYYQGQQPMLYPAEDALGRRLRYRSDGTLEEVPRKKKRSESQTTATATDPNSIDNDVLTTQAEQAAVQAATAAEVRETTVVVTEGLPTNWEGFIKLAAKLTDHQAGVYGFGPTLFASEGGREFSQWAVQSGLKVQIPSGDTARLDINTSGAAEVAQFMKDLHWRFDVTPPPAKCYNDNLMRMFAEGKLGMMILPADGNTIDRLIKLGMTLDDIGISVLPAGEDNRGHLTYGRCYIVNSQLDRDRRAAAFKWLLFQLDPEVLRLREQFYFREQEYTGLPQVPLYLPEHQKAVYDAVKPYRTLPLYMDYEASVANLLTLEPPYFTDRLYEAIAEGVRPIIEREESDPAQAITLVAIDFEKKYLNNAPTKEGLQRYLSIFTGRP